MSKCSGCKGLKKYKILVSKVDWLEQTLQENSLDTFLER